jgi:sulfur-carrier protein
MEVTVKYFAWVRERVGSGEERVNFPEAVKTVRDAITWLKHSGEGYAAAFERQEVIRAAVDHTHACHDARLPGPREIAFFPPITGG